MVAGIRAFTGCLQVPACASRMVVLGGCTQDGKRLSDVFSLNLDSWSWTKQMPLEQVPLPLSSFVQTYQNSSSVLSFSSSPCATAYANA